MTAFGCARCLSRWDGYNTAHCESCHATFTTVRVFDSHRRDGKFLPPRDVGLVLARRDYRCWTTPMRPGFAHPSKFGRLLLPAKGNGPSLDGDAA